jgi:HEAT repeat protein
MADLLPQDNVPRADILRVLGKLKDERAAAAIAARLQSDRQPAADALRAIGPGAEKAVLAYLNHADGGVSAEARKLLKEWNTKNDVLIGQTIKDLDAATDAARRRPALGFLTQADVEDALRGKVNKALEPLLTDNMVQGDAYKAFFHWAGRESLPILIKLIVSDPSPYRRQAMDAAAKLKDESAAGAIATRIPTGDRAHASKTLKSMGSIAERAVVKYLGNNDAAVRIEVLYILREIGTRASVPFVLQAMKADPKNKNLIKAAQEAGAAMSGR